MTAGYSTPAYTSLDVPRSVSLVYSSAMAYPLGVVPWTSRTRASSWPSSVSISAVRGGVNETFTNGTTELYVSQSSTDTATKRLAGQISTVLSTGIYYDTTTIKSRWTSGPYAGTVTQTSVPTTLLIDNESVESRIGAGWGIAGLQHLVFTSDSLSLAITNGTGSILLFTRPTKTSPWVSPLGRLHDAHDDAERWHGDELSPRHAGRHDPHVFAHRLSPRGEESLRRLDAVPLQRLEPAHGGRGPDRRLAHARLHEQQTQHDHRSRAAACRISRSMPAGT